VSAGGARALTAVVIAALAFLAACGGGELPELDALDAEPWMAAGAFDFVAEEDGAQLSMPITIPGGGRGFALYVEVAGCAQVARLETGAFEGEAARVWVSDLERGVSCTRCAERFSVIAGSGLVVHDPIEPEDLDATLRFGRVDCETLTKLPPGEPASLRLWARALPVAREVEPLPLAFLHGAASPWAAPQDAERLAAAVGELLVGAGLEVALVRSSAHAALDAPLEWFEGTPEVLPSLAVNEQAVNIAFAGCLAHVHPLLGNRVPLEGFVPRVPALGSPGAAVYLRHLGCGGSGGSVTRRSVDAQARLVAHELGHFLGLYHPEDADGQRDRLPDTNADTLMTAPPADLEGPRFSPLQAARMRLHAALLAQGLPRRAPLPTTGGAEGAP